MGFAGFNFAIIDEEHGPISLESAQNMIRAAESANKETMIIAHIEGVEGINNLNEILSVPGIDVIFIGPYDLSQSLGVPGEVNHPLVKEEKMKKVILKCKKNKVAVVTFADDIKLLNLGFH